MKKIVFGILVGFLFVFAGCNDNDEGYSLGDMWVGFGIFKVDEVDSYKIILDCKDVLIPVASNYPPGWGANIDNGERVFVNYTILDEVLESSLPAYYVKINSIKEILMKDVIDITPEIEDSIGNDPIVVEDYWMTDSLLSFKLRYWGYDTTHFLNLGVEPSMSMAPGIQPYELELRHNANDDEDAIYYTAYVSFSLNDLRIEGLDSVQFVVTSTDYDGVEFSEEFVFNYSDLPDDIRNIQ
ncbi:MAG: hypothetical protein GQ525_13085 [Draconibacterium sp.]|nr:hypothetical protein [Draconibacterium sp.]